MGLPIDALATAGFELVFSSTDELKKPFTFIINRDVGDTNLTYDPVTRSYPVAAMKETELTIDDTRYVGFKEKEILNSNGTLTHNMRKVFIRYSDLGGTSVSEVDQGELPDGSIVEIKSIKYVPEVDPIFLIVVIEGVNDALSINA